MSDFYTVLATVLSGTIVFIIGEIFMEVVIIPAQAYRELKGKIAFVLLFYSDIYNNPREVNLETTPLTENYAEASKELRKIAAEVAKYLQSNQTKRIDLFKVSSNLIYLSNSLSFLTGHEPEIKNQDVANEIISIMRIRSNRN